MPLTRRLALFGVVLLSALLLSVAACGGDDDGTSGDATTTATASDDATPEGDDDAPTGDDDDPTPAGDGGDDELAGIACTLLTDGEVSAVLGGSVDSEPSDFAPFYNCGWTNENFESLSLDLYSDNDEALEFYYELTQEAEDVDGLGNRAHWSSNPSILEVLTDDFVVSITYFGADLEDDTHKGDVVKLMEKALDRLP